jgi:hypothetical protein
MPRKGGLFGDADCERPACDDVKKALPTSLDDLTTMVAKRAAADQKVECPPRSADLGRSSWKLLHSMVRIILE